MIGAGKSWGIKLENKAMETDARVKNYSMEILGDNGERVSAIGQEEFQHKLLIPT